MLYSVLLELAYNTRQKKIITQTQNNHCQSLNGLVTTPSEKQKAISGSSLYVVS